MDDNVEWGSKYCGVLFSQKTKPHAHTSPNIRGATKRVPGTYQVPGIDMSVGVKLYIDRFI